jgi:hypothetical protein
MVKIRGKAYLEERKQKINRSELKCVKFKLENLINLSLANFWRIRRYSGGLGRQDMGWGR